LNVSGRCERYWKVHLVKKKNRGPPDDQGKGCPKKAPAAVSGDPPAIKKSPKEEREVATVPVGG